MRHSGTITLFSERPNSGPPTVSLVLSVAAHAAAVALIAFGILSTPRIKDRPLNERYAVRRLDLHMPPPRPQRALDAELRFPGTQSPSTPLPAAAGAASRQSPARQVAKLTPAPQTLLQPKLHLHQLAEKIPVPNVVIWQMDTAKKTNIIPPLPKTQTASVVQPSADPPTEELNVDKIALAATQAASKQPILPSTTSPLVSIAPQPTPAPPQTTSKSTEQPAPAAVVSLSDLRTEGTVILPDANQTASSNSSGTLGAGRPEENGRTNQDRAGRGTDGSKANNSGSAAKPDTSDGGAGRNQQAQSGQPGSGSTIVGQPASASYSNSGTVERIVLPKDGQFGAVIVGSSLEEVYPEAAELWGGRLAYTVYLHVGLAKGWILQYTLPPAVEAAAGGNAGRLAAPWPFTIVRPNLALSDINADALMVHGIIDTAGRFESLAVAFPPRYQQADFVIGSLRQWEFRPATQGGKPIAVEILLIIPAEND